MHPERIDGFRATSPGWSDRRSFLRFFCGSSTPDGAVLSLQLSCGWRMHPQKTIQPVRKLASVRPRNRPVRARRAQGSRLHCKSDSRDNPAIQITPRSRGHSRPVRPGICPPRLCGAPGVRYCNASGSQCPWLFYPRPTFSAIQNPPPPSRRTRHLAGGSLHICASNRVRRCGNYQPRGPEIWPARPGPTTASRTAPAAGWAVGSRAGHAMIGNVCKLRTELTSCLADGQLLSHRHRAHHPRFDVNKDSH
ncbi:hypothetical protein C8Q72DRAFT_613533 [Fomitopsis betulina]|nr:hypothetical protein C8Q72DRAFT_613533 [Fomitopsis betulina]